MKRLNLILLCFLLTSLLYAQTDQPVTKSKSTVKEKILPFSMGSGTTDQGSYTITFDSPMETEYTIMLTPMSGETTLYVSEQTREKAVIRSADGSSVPFQFIVFIRRPAVQPASRPGEDRL